MTHNWWLVKNIESAKSYRTAHACAHVGTIKKNGPKWYDFRSVSGWSTKPISDSMYSLHRLFRLRKTTSGKRRFNDWEISSVAAWREGATWIQWGWSLDTESRTLVTEHGPKSVGPGPDSPWNPDRLHLAIWYSTAKFRIKFENRVLCENASFWNSV